MDQLVLVVRAADLVRVQRVQVLELDVDLAQVGREQLDIQIEHDRIVQILEQILVAEQLRNHGVLEQQRGAFAIHTRQVIPAGVLLFFWDQAQALAAFSQNTICR